MKGSVALYKETGGRAGAGDKGGEMVVTVEISGRDAASTAGHRVGVAWSKCPIPVTEFDGDQSFSGVRPSVNLAGNGQVRHAVFIEVADCDLIAGCHGVGDRRAEIGLGWLQILGDLALVNGGREDLWIAISCVHPYWMRDAVRRGDGHVVA